MTNVVTSIYFFCLSFVLANTLSVSKAGQKCFLPDSYPKVIQDFFCDKPFFIWVVAIFGVISLVVASVAKLTENLQKIIDFFQKNLLRKKTEVSDGEKLKLRTQLLNRLQSDISIRQRNSLHKLIQIDLAKEEQRQKIGQPKTVLAPEDRVKENNNFLNRITQVFSKKDGQETELKPTQKTIEFYDRDDIQGKLLILGEPGAGKTTELLDLAQDLVRRAIEDENAPIPIIFELSSWKDDLPIKNWLIEQLPKLYRGLSKPVAEYWIENQRIIPLLDGLDELGLQKGDECIDAINQFLQESFQPGLVVCCRVEEYERFKYKLHELKGAIYLRPLSDAQIQQYLKDLNRSNIWNETIANEPIMLELVRTPLFLTMLVIAYQGRAIKTYSELFEKYIDKQLNDPNNQGIYPPKKNLSGKQTLHYLTWLARKLEATRETEFLIESIQPTWLESSKQKVFYKVTLGLIYGLSGGAEGRRCGWVC